MNDNNNAALIRIDNVVEYKSSTQHAEEFINARLSAAIAGWNKTTGDTIPDEGVQVTSRVFTCVRKDSKPVFVPFWLSLPMSALEGQYGKKNKNGNQNKGTVNLLDMANRRNGGHDVGDSGNIRLRDPYAAIVEQYMFDQDDLEDLLKNRDAMHSMHLTPDLVKQIKHHAKLHVHRFKKGCTRVIVLIDPSKVYRDIIISGNKDATDLNNRPFEVKMHATQSTGTGKWNYKVTCSVTKGKKNKNGKRNGGGSESDMINGQLANL